MNVSDGTLGRMKYGTANPTLDVLCNLSNFYRIEPWQLLVPGGPSLDRAALSSASSSAVSPQAQQLIDRLRDMESSGNSSPALIDTIERILDLVEPAAGKDDYPGLKDEFGSDN